MNVKLRFTILPLYLWERNLCALIGRQKQNIWFYQKANSFISFVVQLLITAPSGQFRHSSFACNVRESHLWSETAFLFILSFTNSAHHNFIECFISMNQKPTSFRILYSLQYILELTYGLFWKLEIHKTDVLSYDNLN